MIDAEGNWVSGSEPVSPLSAEEDRDTARPAPRPTAPRGVRQVPRWVHVVAAVALIAVLWVVFWRVIPPAHSAALSSPVAAVPAVTVTRTAPALPVAVRTATATVTATRRVTDTRTRVVIQQVPVTVRAVVRVPVKAKAPACVQLRPHASTRVGGDLIEAFGFGETCGAWTTLDTAAVSTGGPTGFTVTAVLYRRLPSGRVVRSAIVATDRQVSGGHVVWVRRRVEAHAGADGWLVVSVRVGSRTGAMRLAIG